MERNKLRKLLFIVLWILALVYLIILISTNFILTKQAFLFIFIIVLLRLFIDIVAPKDKKKKRNK